FPPYHYKPGKTDPILSSPILPLRSFLTCPSIILFYSPVQTEAAVKHAKATEKIAHQRIHFLDPLDMELASKKHYEAHAKYDDAHPQVIDRSHQSITFSLFRSFVCGHLT